MDIKVKICGLTNYEDAALAVTCGADILGFIFAESARQVTALQVKEILAKLKEHGMRDGITAVGVFVNEKKENIEAAMQQSGIDIVQLHGDELPATANHYSFPWYKVFHVASREDVNKHIFPKGYLWHCTKFLVDTKVPGTYGGTGKRIDRDAGLYAKAMIQQTGKEFFLAGGITPENVYEILCDVQPDGIDIGSGVEESKGKKSKEKMALLFREVQRYRKSKKDTKA